MMIVQPARFAATATDPYWSFVKLLVQPATGASSVTDYSSAAKAITLNGNAALGGASPWSGYQGVALDGSGDYMSLADSADWALSGAWAIDWVGRLNAVSGMQSLVAQWASGNAADCAFELWTNGTSVFFDLYTGTTLTRCSFTASVSTASTHIAVSSDGTTLRGFIGGTGAGTATYAAANNSTQPLQIGREGSSSSLDMAGSVAAVRVTVGSHRGYTGASIANAVTNGAFPTA